MNKKFLLLVSIVSAITTVATFVLYKKLRKIHNDIRYTIQYIPKQPKRKYLIDSYFDKGEINIISVPYSRAQFIDNIQQSEGLQLEIGPYFTPVLKGDNVRYFDVLDKEGLIEKAKIDEISVDNIPYIDYVEPHGDMSLIRQKFDIVFSSHNIEHQVNLVKHFQQVENLLKRGGKFYLAIPDKRYCFDHFIFESPLSMVLATYWENPQNHSLQTILAKCETGHNESKKHWEDDSGVPLFMKNKECFKQEYINYKNSNNHYIDAHKWRFTPQSFAFIISELNRIKLTSLKVGKIWDTALHSHEFYAILVKE